jgi:hypothetical protein
MLAPWVRPVSRVRTTTRIPWGAAVTDATVPKSSISPVNILRRYYTIPVEKVNWTARRRIEGA